MIQNINYSNNDDNLGLLIDHAAILSQKILELKLPDNLSLLSSEQSKHALDAINELKIKVENYKRIAETLNKEINQNDRLIVTKKVINH